MKKMMLLAVAVVFGIGAFVGFQTSSAQAGPCYWRCICSVPYKCCTTPTGTKCKPDPHGPIQCPQYDC